MKALLLQCNQSVFVNFTLQAPSQLYFNKKAALKRLLNRNNQNSF